MPVNKVIYWMTQFQNVHWSASLSFLWRLCCWSQSWLWLRCPPQPTTAMAPWPALRVQTVGQRRKKKERGNTPRPMRLSSKTHQTSIAPPRSWTAPWATSNTKSPPKTDFYVSFSWRTQITKCRNAAFSPLTSDSNYAAASDSETRLCLLVRLKSLKSNGAWEYRS